ncbi:hypothetical protein F4779DRAFT_247299 [Xylariaceae sp. FL0662B]|nr:hypothetical protein F4779DRAFT_247299 [Xylariaceae sp. FL0662B]
MSSYMMGRRRVMSHEPQVTNLSCVGQGRHAHSSPFEILRMYGFVYICMHIRMHGGLGFLGRGVFLASHHLHMFYMSIMSFPTVVVGRACMGSYI